MSRFEDTCPYDARNRANRCQSCHTMNNNLPPCVSAYLNGSAAMPTENVISIRRVEPISVRKAA